MIRIQNGCLLFGSASVCLPEGMVLSCDPDPCMGRVGMRNRCQFESPDGLYTLSYIGETEAAAAQEELMFLLGDSGYKTLSDIRPCNRGGLAGYEVFYATEHDRFQHYEARFDLPGNRDGLVQLAVCLSLDRAQDPQADILSVFASEDVQRALAGVRSV